MRKHQLVLIAIAIGFCGSAGLLAGALYMSWYLASREQAQQLQAIAAFTLKRSQEAIDRTVETLKGVARVDEPCSDFHRMQLRAAIFDSTLIDDLGYYRNRELICTAWGKPPARIGRTPSDFTTSNGVEINLAVSPWVSPHHTRMLVVFGNYAALVDSERLTDVPRPSDARIILRADNGVIASTQNWEANSETGPEFSARAEASVPANLSVALVQNKDWNVLVMQGRKSFSRLLISQHSWILATAILFMGAFNALVIWILRRRLSPVGELKAALRARRMQLHYQPIIDLSTGRCVGAEALARFRSPDGRMLLPDNFIALTEKYGFVSSVTRLVVEIATEEMSAFLRANQGFHLALNLSADDVNDKAIITLVHACFGSAGIRPDQVWFELTERTIASATARDVISFARRLGYAISLDDFGTGYSSLQYLQDIPADALKIDRTFVQEVGQVPVSRCLATVIIDLARSRGLLIVAEGIETLAQEQFLRERGVQYGQGWLYSKALNFGEFSDFYRHNHTCKPAGSVSGLVGGGM